MTENLPISSFYLRQGSRDGRPMHMTLSRTVNGEVLQNLGRRFIDLCPYTQNPSPICIIAVVSSGYPLASAIEQALKEAVSSREIYISGIDIARPVRIAETWLDQLATMNCIVVDNSITTGKTARLVMEELANHQIHPQSFVKVIDHQDSAENEVMNGLRSDYPDTDFMSLYLLAEAMVHFKQHTLLLNSGIAAV